MTERLDTERLDKVSGRCPYGCGDTLFLGDGGHVTCSWVACPRPCAVDELLHLDHEHYVTFDDDGFTVEHPLRERIEGTMHRCPLHVYLQTLDGAPMRPGRYRVVETADRPGWRFQK